MLLSLRVAKQKVTSHSKCFELYLIHERWKSPGYPVHLRRLVTSVRSKEEKEQRMDGWEPEGDDGLGREGREELKFNHKLSHLDFEGKQ